jgi:hypothetical protein
MSDKIVRRPDFAGGGITDEEREQLAAHTAMWIKRVMRTDPIEPDKITSAIKDLYRVSELKEPRVVIVPSPRVMALAGGFAAGIWYLRKKGAVDLAATPDLTSEAISAATALATHSATDYATDAATDNATALSTRVATLDSTFDATFVATNAATDVATRAATFADTDDVKCDDGMVKFLLGCAKRWSRMYQGGNMWGAWDCYLSAGRDILKLRLKEHEKYSAWEQCSINGGFRIMHEEFCIVSDFPVHIKIDERNLPHCEDGPSHLWRDGWSIYNWHGVRVPGEWIEDRKSLTAKTALTWENMEQRRAACEIVGWDNIIEQLDARTIDKDEDDQIGELLSVDIPDIGRENFLRVRCGTGRMFALPVPPDVKTAHEANAWTYGLNTKEYQPESRA